MAAHQVIGIYNSVARARLAVEALVVEGLPEKCIALSTDLTADGVAAEAPGESYENQPSGEREHWFGSRRSGSGEAHHATGYSDAVNSGTCVVTADVHDADEAQRVRDIMEALRPVDMRSPAAT